MKEILSILVLLLVTDTLATFFVPFNGHSGAKPFLPHLPLHIPNPFLRPSPPPPCRNYWESQRQQGFYGNPPPLNQYSHAIKADEGTWLCHNTKTGNLIIFSENEQCKAECQATSIPQTLPTQSARPSHQNNDNIPPKTVIVDGSTWGNPKETNNQATTENTNGAGLIDVRFGGQEN